MREKVPIFSAETGKVIGMDRVVRSDEEWKRSLSPEQFSVARKEGTEPPFRNAYFDNKRKGIYRCVCCGIDLFSSEAKYDSGTGWPSFWQPVSPFNISVRTDEKLLVPRTEVLCARCAAHLGHVFDDGPAPTYKRYCMNSASLSFAEQ